MRLLKITNIYYFLASGLAFLLLSVVCYAVIRHVIDREFNEKLHLEKRQFIEDLKVYDQLKDILYLNIGDIIVLDSLNSSVHLPEISRDTSMYDPRLCKMMNYREMSFTIMHNKTTYRVSIFKPLVNNKRLLEGIAEIVFLVVFVFISFLSLINILIFKQIWHPFYSTLRKLKAFDVTRPGPLTFDTPKISEFAELNLVVSAITDQSTKDYQTLKEYTENASHEIQTPLMIIQNEVELLIQEPLGKNQLRHAQQIKESAIRLSKLKEGLAVFSKIENHQYIETESINLQHYLTELFDNVADLIDMQNIDFELIVLNNVVLNMNETLAYLLLNNLISNAIKYNLNNGYIKIKLSEELLEFENTGHPLSIDPDQLFTRFKRGESRRESTGLGLSIVKLIAEYYKMEVTYENVAEVHRIQLKLPF